MSLTRRLLALLIGGVAAFAGGALAWTALGVTGFRAWKDGAYIAGPEVVLVVAAAVIAGAVAAFFAWRALVGPPLERSEWSLVFGPRPAAPTGEARAAAATVGDLLTALESWGYTLESSVTDDAGAPTGPAPRDRALGGLSIELRERRPAGRRGRVLVRIPPDRRAGEEALGFLDVTGALDGLYEELGRYTIGALGRLYPELTYKRMDSGLTEESAAALCQELPARPEQLG